MVDALEGVVVSLSNACNAALAYIVDFHQA
jgi:hypothetical protein